MSFPDQKDNIVKHFYPLSNGMILFRNKGSNTMLDMQTFKITYLNRFPSDLSKWFAKEYDEIRDIHVSTTAPFDDGSRINIFEGFLHANDNNGTYQRSSKRAKEGCDMMLDFVKTVWADGDDKVYEYLLNWFANVAQGKKNDSILYLKSITQGIGKSTLTQFISKYVIGDKISIEASSEPLRSSFNAILSGKVLVTFEELETANQSEWYKISSALKRMSTSDEIQYADKHVKSYRSKNLNNYIINTNTEAVKDSEGRRYMCLTLNTKYKGDTDYFDKLYNKTMNDEVGKAFYHMLCERDTSKFNAQKMPKTFNKEMDTNDRLDPLFAFLKFNYLLKKVEIEDVTSKILENQYKAYCDLKQIKHVLTKRKMMKNLREVGVTFRASNSRYICDIDNAKLDAIAKKFKWYMCDDMDELTDNDLETVCSGDFVARDLYMSVVKDNHRLLKRIKELESSVQTMKQYTKKQRKKKTKSPTTIDFD